MKWCAPEPELEPLAPALPAWLDFFLGFRGVGRVQMVFSSLLFLLFFFLD
jgi:hypothetical protein